MPGPRHHAAAILAVLLLTACTTGSPPSAGGPAPAPEAGRAASTDPNATPPGGADVDKETAPPESTLPITPAGDALEQVTYPPGAVIDQPGLYFLDVALGRVEGWRLGQRVEGRERYSVSSDNRYVTAEADSAGYLADRRTGQVYQWDSDQLTLVAFGPDRVVFERCTGDDGDRESTRTFHVTDGDLRPLATFTLPEEWRCCSIPTAVVAPDGQTVAVLVHNQPQEGRPLFYLLDLNTGTARPVGQAVPPEGGQSFLRVDRMPRHGEPLLALEHWTMRWNAPDQTMVERYRWDGRPVDEFTVPGWDPVLSPGGSLLSWTEQPAAVMFAVRVSTAAGEDQFRVLSAGVPTWGGAFWLADASGFIITNDTGAYLVTRTGDVRTLPYTGYPEQHYAVVVPAPDDPNRLAVGRLKVADLAGHVIQEARVAEGQWHWLPIGPWGDDSRELRFAMIPEYGHDGWDGTVLPLPPRVERPPFTDAIHLQVRDPRGECLNLRKAPSLAAPVIRCLPDGAHMVVAEPDQSAMPSAFADGHQWAFVRTAAEEGWVAISTGSVGWAEAPAQGTADAAPPPALVQQLLTAGWKLSGLQGLPPLERPAAANSQAELVYQGGALRLQQDREGSIHALVVDHSHPDYQEFQALESGADFVVAHAGKYTSVLRIAPVSQATRAELAAGEWTRAEVEAMFGEPTSRVHNHGIGTYTVTYLPQGLMFEEGERLRLVDISAEEIWQQRARALVSACTHIDEVLAKGKPSPDGRFQAGYLDGGGYWSQYIVVRETGKSEALYHAEYFIQDYFWLDSRRLVYREAQPTSTFHVIDVVAETVTPVKVSGGVEEFGPAGDGAIWYKDRAGRKHEVQVPLAPFGEASP